MLHRENSLWNSGIRFVAGVDEAGIGPLAGPVVAAAVIFRPGTRILGVDDSKRIAPSRRRELSLAIQASAISTSVGFAEVVEINRLNIYQAGVLAMRRAIMGLEQRPDHILLDARVIPGLSIPQEGIKQGDQTCFSIAAASILAKTHRDRLMRDLDHRYPGYGFARHKGYATPEHQKAIRQNGPLPVHRLSFPVFQELLGKCSALFYTFEADLAAVESVPELDRFEEAFRCLSLQVNRFERDRLKQRIQRKRNALKELCDADSLRR
jgi:ribonuclease HII